MKFVIASDSFKGSLSNETINGILASVLKSEFKYCTVVPLLVADGGDGTLDAVIKQNNGTIETVNVNNPLFKIVKSRCGFFENNAVISMCEASGLTMISDKERNPLKTTSFGTGELIKYAVNKGCKNIYITLGGSATNDGGIGALTALGYKFIKRDGTVCKGIGEELIDIVSIDSSNAIDVSKNNFIILSDVTNPMTGDNGATKVFAKQKGANNNQIEFLEKGMLNFKKVLEQYAGNNVDSVVGGGAAGGIGASLSIILNAKIQSGIDTVLDMVDFDKVIADADYIFTGEGKIDFQSKDGKVISGILKHAKKQNIPVIALVGTIGEGFEKLYDYGLTSVFSLINSPMDLKTVLEKSTTLYETVAKNVCRLIKQF